MSAAFHGVCMGPIAPPLPQLLLRDIAGGLKIHEKAWGLVTGEVQRWLLGAEAMTGVHHGQPSAISVGTGRVCTVAEALL
jgi:hypothetical protein